MISFIAFIISFFLFTATYADFGPKRGLSFNDPFMTTNFGGAGSKVTWCFNWDSVVEDIPTYLEYVPMLWSGDSQHITQWFNNADAAISSGQAKSLLAFNEPNNPNQANMDPTSAATIYYLYMSPFHVNAEVGAPAVGNSYDGLNWLTQFLDECAKLDCAVDFVPVHWYGSASDTAGFYSYVNDACIAGSGRQLWVTEFNAAGTEDEQISFLQEVLPWLDNQTYIRRYSWFGAFPGNLVDSDGLLSLTGMTYAFS